MWVLRIVIEKSLDLINNFLLYHLFLDHHFLFKPWFRSSWLSATTSKLLLDHVQGILSFNNNWLIIFLCCFSIEILDLSFFIFHFNHDLEVIFIAFLWKSDHVMYHFFCLKLKICYALFFRSRLPAELISIFAHYFVHFCVV